jgi:hypothetical protein
LVLAGENVTKIQNAVPKQDVTDLQATLKNSPKKRAFALFWLSDISGLVSTDYF